jgi:hypothetical protein
MYPTGMKYSAPSPVGSGMILFSYELMFPLESERFYTVFFFSRIKKILHRTIFYHRIVLSCFESWGLNPAVFDTEVFYVAYKITVDST